MRDLVLYMLSRHNQNLQDPTMDFAAPRHRHNGNAAPGTPLTLPRGSERKQEALYDARPCVSEAVVALLSLRQLLEKKVRARASSEWHAVAAFVAASVAIAAPSASSAWQLGCSVQWLQCCSLLLCSGIGIAVLETVADSTSVLSHARLQAVDVLTRCRLSYTVLCDTLTRSLHVAGAAHDVGRRLRRYWLRAVPPAPLATWTWRQRRWSSTSTAPVGCRGSGASGAVGGARPTRLPVRRAVHD